MKVLLVAAALLAVQVSCAPPAEMMACMEKHGVTKDDIMTFAEKGEASEAMKCNMKCNMLSNGGMTEDAKLVLEPMLKHAPEKMHDILKECVNIEQGGSDLCDLAFRHNVCIREKAPEFYMEMTKAMRR